jgi:alpha-D-xyloside xylohydrolase
MDGIYDVASFAVSWRGRRLAREIRKGGNIMTGFRQEEDALLWEMNGETLRIEPWGKDSLRVRSAAMGRIRDDLPGALLEPAATTAQIEIRDGAGGATIINGGLTACVSVVGGVTFVRSDTNAELLAEQPAHFMWPGARFFKSAGGDLWRLEAHFRAYDYEHLYGLGQHTHGRLDQKGCVINLLQQNTEVSIPFLLSSRGYGFLWNNPAVGQVELGYNGTRWIAEATRQMDYWITAGDTPAAILEHYADATGHAPMLPEWAAGFWQCKLRYETQEELLAVAREYHRRGLPLSVIVSDFFHWTLQGDWQFDPICWPDPAGMVAELAEMGVRLMVSVWPTVNALSPNFAEMQRRDLLIRTERGLPPHMAFVDTRPEGRVYVHHYDATNPEARAFLWDKLKQNYYRHGIKVWWLDACEPEMYPMHPDNLRFHLGAGLEVANIYPMLHERGVFEGMQREGESEIITLCRSAWAGSQRYGAALWSGDIPSTFESLQTQVRAGLNVAMSGIPWWTTDIGGFHGGDINTPYFRELIVRWFQYGVFCPLFRLHGYRLPANNQSGADNEVWSFGDEAYRIIEGLLCLRERLRPYIMEQMAAAHEHGLPPMRPLCVDFPGDPVIVMMDDEFMFGPDLLVAPVVEQGQTERHVYLPDGATWTDAWTGEVYEGGNSITADAPLDRIPLYLRDAAVLPIKG